MTLQQQAIKTIEIVPEEKLPVLIEFAHFLSTSSSFVEQYPILDRVLGAIK